MTPGPVVVLDPASGRTGLGFREDRLFIEMRFLVDRDGATVEVRNVDVFTFVGGVAVRRVAHLDPAALLGG